jgi:hypothetical protein
MKIFTSQIDGSSPINIEEIQDKLKELKINEEEAKKKF